MNKITKVTSSVLTGLIVLGMSAAAFAAPDKAPDNRADSGWHGKRDDGKFREHMQERMAKRLTELHDKLKLNASQETGWKTFAAAMTPSHDMAKRTDRAEWKNLSAPDRMEKMLGRMKEAEARMTTRLSAVKTFYATLNPEQQKIFNDGFAHGKGRDHGRR